MAWENTNFQRVLEALEVSPRQSGSIERACYAVQDCLVKNKYALMPSELFALLVPDTLAVIGFAVGCRDNLRGFFEHCFPVLIKRLFGYEALEASWLSLIAQVPASALRLQTARQLPTMTMQPAAAISKR